MLFRLRVNTSFRPSTARTPVRSQSYDFLARACHSPAYSRHPALRLTPADSKQAEHTYVHTSCLADRVSMTQTLHLPQKHICADSTRSLLTSERTNERASSRLPQQQPRSDIISASTAAFHPHPPLSPRCVIHLVLLVFYRRCLPPYPVSRLALRTELRHLTCNVSITQSYV